MIQIKNPNSEIDPIQKVNRFVVVKEFNRSNYEFEKDDIFYNKEEAFEHLEEKVNRNHEVWEYNSDYLRDAIPANAPNEYRKLLELAINSMSDKDLEQYGYILIGSNWCGYGIYDGSDFFVQPYGENGYNFGDYALYVVELDLFHNPKTGEYYYDMASLEKDSPIP